MSEDRKALTKFQFAQLVLEQQGLCGCGCGDKLIFEPRQIRDEHLAQLSLGGTNEMKNRSLWRLECTKAKDAKDARARAKVRSLTGANKPKVKAKINSRDFQKTPDNYNAWGNAKGFRRDYKSNVKQVDKL